ncbi:NYN domain-containing protein [Shinella sp. PSBB067]|uniref:NYN domain-containing protein n=1 Tax=Shinella sp. PSBB067 TaxID=2715959 RepID=UPI00193AE099|nr:NYN domain-containing protein [Shinella sp. PSBB067]QRI65233.1 NYN domain-containing protein [Shinella sp. PSBB067]
MAMTAQYVAVFIDAENVSVSAAAAILEEAARHGTVRERRLYGDFNRCPQLSTWLDIAPRHALTPCQTAGGAVGKNGADIALVIDAVAMLCRNEADVFCIATSDGDFTQLAIRIRQEGKTVIGLGRERASLRFREACDAFVATEVAKAPPPAVTAVKKPSPAAKAPTPRKLEADLLHRAFAAAPRVDGEWVRLQDMLNALQACRPGFKVKSYGHSQLCKLLAFSEAELADKNRKVRIRKPALKAVVDNRQPYIAAAG